MKPSRRWTSRPLTGVRRGRPEGTRRSAPPARTAAIATPARACLREKRGRAATGAGTPRRRRRNSASLGSLPSHPAARASPSSRPAYSFTADIRSPVLPFRRRFPAGLIQSRWSRTEGPELFRGASAMRQPARRSPQGVPLDTRSTEPSCRWRDAPGQASSSAGRGASACSIANRGSRRSSARGKYQADRAEQVEHRRQEHAADHERVEEDGAREPDAEELDHPLAAEDERGEHDHHHRRGRRDHAPRLDHPVADRAARRPGCGVHSSWMRETRNTS